MFYVYVREADGTRRLHGPFITKVEARKSAADMAHLRDSTVEILRAESRIFFETTLREVDASVST